MIDALADESVRFANARTVAPLTLPAHASMLTGLYPPRHGLRDNGLRALPESAPTLAERCAAEGYETVAFVSAAVLDPAFGLDQGFDRYDAPARPTAGSAHYSLFDAEHTVAETIQWLRDRDPDRPFLAWVHFFDPHVPYAPPERFLHQAGGHAHRGEIARVDAAVGRLVAALENSGELDRTAIVLTTDHGEALGAHGEPTHGALCYDATLRVPLLVRLPGLARAGEVVEDVVSVVDIHPTILGLVGMEYEAGVDGRDLLAALPAERGVYFESYAGYLNYGWSPLAGWMDAEGKYLHSSAPEFYDLRTDPGEVHDLAVVPGPTFAPYRDGISAVFAAPVVEGSAAANPLSDDLLRDLRALGYGALGAELEELPHPLAASDLPSPKERAVELEPLLLASALGDAGRPAEAIPHLEGILADNSRHAMALDALAFALMQLSRFEEAHPVLERRLALGMPRADTLINLAVCHELLGDRDAARAAYRRALELDPENVQCLETLVRLCEAAGDLDQAARWRGRLADLSTD